jgi:hypothetical protein
MEQESLGQQPVSPRRWWKNPIYLGLLGLALMIAGWQLSQSLPPSSPRRVEQQAQLAELRRMADDPALAERLDRLATIHRGQPPLEWPGRLLFFGGLLLFIGAGISMACSNAPNSEPPSLESDCLESR